MEGLDLTTLVSVLGGALSAYVAIKKDIATLHIKCDTANRAAEAAHKRIDKHIQGEIHEKANAKA